MNLGATLGKVTSGSHTTAGFKEDKKNKATPGITAFCTLLFRLFIILFIAFFGQTLFYGILFDGVKTSANGFFRSLTNNLTINLSGVFIGKSVKLRESWSFVQGKELSIGFKTEVQ